MVINGWDTAEDKVNFWWISGQLRLVFSSEEKQPIQASSQFLQYDIGVT